MCFFDKNRQCFVRKMFNKKYLKSADDS